MRKQELQQQHRLQTGEQQKQAYLHLQAGGEVPIHGFQKPVPEKPKGKFKNLTKLTLVCSYFG